MTLILPRRSLDIDFLADGQASGDNYPTEISKLDPILNFSRASTATRINSAGLLEVVAAGQPRFDFDPVTRLPRGFLVEEQRTNLLWPSNDVAHGNWVAQVGGAGSAPVRTSGQTGPYGLTATRLQMSSGGSAGPDYSSLYYAVNGLPNPHAVTRSCWVRSNTGGPQVVGFFNGNTNQQLIVTTTWQRVANSIAYAGTTDYIQFYAWPATGSSANVDIMVAGCQLESAGTASSYIPTTTAPATRSADICYIDSLVPWLPADGTLSLVVDAEVSSPASDCILVSGRTVGAAPTYLLLLSASNVYNRWPSATEHNTGLSALARLRVAMAVDAAGQYRYARNGVSGAVRADAAKLALERLYLGSYNGSQYFLNGWLRSVSLSAGALSDLGLRAASTID